MSISGTGDGRKGRIGWVTGAGGYKAFTVAVSLTTVVFDIDGVADIGCG